MYIYAYIYICINTPNYTYNEAPAQTKRIALSTVNNLGTFCPRS